MTRRTRTRLQALAALCVIVPVGLISRHEALHLPLMVGDVLWACLFFCVFRVLLPLARTRTVAALTLAFGLLVEVSQLWQLPVLENVRSHRLGRVLFGVGFSSADLLWITLGTALAATGDWLLTRLGLHPNQPVPR